MPSSVAKHSATVKHGSAPSGKWFHQNYTADSCPCSLGGCAECTQLGCTCAARYMCTFCGALLFAREAQAVRMGRFGTIWAGGPLCCCNGAVQLAPIERDDAMEALDGDDDEEEADEEVERVMTELNAENFSKSAAAPTRQPAVAAAAAEEEEEEDMSAMRDRLAQLKG